MSIFKGQLKKELRTMYFRLKILRCGFWFIDIPRTSSTSIRAELGKRYGMPYGKSNIIEKEYAGQQFFPTHMTAQQACKLFGKIIWKSIFTFTVVRNPWDRVYSMYQYRRKINGIPLEWDFCDYVLALEEAVARTDPSDSKFRLPAHRLGMYDYIAGDNGQIIVKFVVRYETRDDDMKFVASRLHYPELGSCLHLQSATLAGTNYSSAYDSRTKEIVGRIYQKDIELSNYSFDADL
jgi:hypothetical protein